MLHKLSMKVNWLRVKYRLRALVHPSCWLRHRTNRTWDNELWAALERGDIAVVGQYHAIIGERRVWIENHPYASGALEVAGGDITCSGATALYLAHCLPAARIMQRLKGIGPDFETCYMYNDHIII